MKKFNQLLSFLKGYWNINYLVLFVFILFNVLKNLYFHSVIVYQQVTFNNLIFHLTILFSWAFLFAGIALFTRSRVFLMVVYLVQLLYVFVNITYFLYFKNFLFFNVVIQLTGIIPEIAKAGIIPVYYQAVLMLLDLPAFIFLLRNRYLFESAEPDRRKLYLPLILIPVILLSGAYFLRSKRTDLRFNGDAKAVVEYGLLVHQVYKYVDGFKTGQNFIGQLKTSSNILRINGGGKKHSVLVIQMEAIDSSAILAEYKGKPVMPFLNRLRYQSVYYPFVMAYHLGGGTSDSEFTVINSVQPLVDYPVLKVYEYEFENSFLKVLTNKGFKTLAYHGNAGTFWDRSRTFPRMGFEEFHDLIKLNLKNVEWGAPDHELFKKAAPVINREKDPSLHYMITMSSHNPFKLTESYNTNHTYDGISAEIVRNYYRVLSYVDKNLEEFLAGLDLSNTEVVIVGDHGNGINNTQYKGSSFDDNSTHYEFVPLFILTPDHLKRHNNIAAGLLDVAPTILYLSGISADYHTDGRNLMAPESLTNKIPYKGKWYDRRNLYQKIITMTGLKP
jgi:lipoteichoic acid synthase